MHTPPLDCCTTPAATVSKVLLRAPHSGLSVLRCRCGARWLARMEEAVHWRGDHIDELDMWYSRLTPTEADRLASGASRSLDFLASRPSIHLDRRGRVQAVPSAPTRPTP